MAAGVGSMSGKRRAAGGGGKVQPGDGLLSGPAACMRARNSGRVCDKCGDKPLVLHVPTRKAGAWCERHCPACNPAGPELKPAAGGVVRQGSHRRESFRRRVRIRQNRNAV
jgi:hypothetical protein